MKKIKNSEVNSTEQSLCIYNLPPELVFLCFSFLSSPKDLVALSKTSHFFREIALDEKFWQKFKNLLPKPEIEYYNKSENGYSIRGLLPLPYGLMLNGQDIYETKDFNYLGTLDVVTNFIDSSSLALTLLTNNRVAYANSAGGIEVWKLNYTWLKHRHVFSPKFWQRRHKKHQKFYQEKVIQIVKCKHNPKRIEALATLPTGYLASGGCYEGNIYIIDTNSAMVIKTLKGHKALVTALLVLKDGRLVSGSGVRSYYHEYNCYDPIRIWNTKTGKCVQQLKGSYRFGKLTNSGGVCAIAELPDSYLAVSRHNNNITIWDLVIGLPIRKLYKEATQLVSLRTRFLVSWVPNQEFIHIWNTCTGKCLQSITFENERVYIGKNSTRLVSGGLTVFNDGSLVCGRSHDGFYIYKFPLIPENRLKKSVLEL